MRSADSIQQVEVRSSRLLNCMSEIDSQGQPPLDTKSGYDNAQPVKLDSDDTHRLANASRAALAVITTDIAIFATRRCRLALCIGSHYQSTAEPA